MGTITRFWTLEFDSFGGGLRGAPIQHACVSPNIMILGRRRVISRGVSMGSPLEPYARLILRAEQSLGHGPWGNWAKRAPGANKLILGLTRRGLDLLTYAIAFQSGAFPLFIRSVGYSKDSNSAVLIR